MTSKPAATGETDEWMVFLGNAIEGLRHAAEKVRERRAEFESKSDWFRRTTKEIPRENSVSRALKQMFDLMRAEQNIYGSGVQAVDLRHISIECEKPRPFDRGTSDHSNPTDLSLVLMMNNELANLPFPLWLARMTPNSIVTARGNSLTTLVSALKAGLGIAMLPCFLGDAEFDLQRCLLPVAELNSETCVRI